jgi:predicted RNA-binding protein with PUA-like domain
MAKWLVKTEPETYSIHDLRRDEVSPWDGVRNALAQQHLRQMEVGDEVLVYHSGKEKAIVGLTEVVREKYLDPTDERGRAVCVDLKFVESFRRPLPLSEIKSQPKLKDMQLVRISRLSVMPLTEAHWRLIVELIGSEVAS